jgi:uncharacterized protein
MVNITPRIPAGRQVIQAYGDGGFRISGQFYRGSVLIFPNQTLAWPVTAMAELSQASLDPIAAASAEIDILLIGCGAAMALIPKALRVWLRGSGIVTDGMDTGAACRTYNVLLSEERRVAAALIAVA